MLFPWLHLALGLGWLLFGMAMLTGLLSGPWSTIQVGEARFSAGWLAVVLGLYNLVRWYHRRGLLGTRRWELAQHRYRQELLRQAKGTNPADPLSTVRDQTP
jgi:hypothetical protein